MQLKRGVVPLYHQIAQILRSQMYSGEYKANDLLPTEEEVIRTYQVSRTTARQAFQVLLNEKLIHRSSGKGTFVAPQIQQQFADWAVDSVDELINVGLRTKKKFLGAKKVQAGQALAKSFHIPLGSELMQFRKVEFLDEQPFTHIVLHIPCDLADRIPLDRMEEKPLFMLLEECCGLQIQEAHQWIAAALVRSEIAKHLNLKQGDPVLLVERHFVDTTGRLVQIDTHHYRTDHMRHHLRLTRREFPAGYPPRVALSPP